MKYRRFKARLICCLLFLSLKTNKFSFKMSESEKITVIPNRSELMLEKEGQVRIPAGCAISGFISRDGNRICGDKIVKSICNSLIYI